MNNQDNGLLLVISGPSGVGKGTVCGELIKKNPDIVPSISATTRKPRNNDIDGVTYYFKSTDEFEKMIKNSDFMEWAKYNENYYGTPIAPVTKQLDLGNVVLLEIDVQGALNIKEKYPDALYIFIAPKDISVLHERLSGRGTETPEEIKKRISAAEHELLQKDKYDCVVINDILEDTVEEIENIINQRRNAL